VAGKPLPAFFAQAIDKLTFVTHNTSVAVFVTLYERHLIIPMAVSRVFAKEVNATLARLGISQREAAKRSRISPGYISNMCLGQVPSLGKLLQFISGLDIDPEPLLQSAGYPQISLPGQTPPHPVVRPFETSTCTVPLLGEVPGGNWRLAAQETTESYPVHQVYRDLTNFCLRIVGDSMWPHLQDGDVVGVKAQSTADQGQVIVARLGEEVTVKRLICERGEWMLAPFNPVYQPIHIDFDSPDFAILGVVAWHTHDWLLSDDRVAIHRQRQRKPRPAG
jgi:SOS-response transcriptional repressor LexA